MSVFAGAAAFLRPESALQERLNDDGDTDDAVVHLFPGRGGVAENLRRAATAVSLSSALVVALVDEAADGRGPLNGDGDESDTVVQVYDRSASGWHELGRAADAVDVEGSIVAFLVPEQGEGRGSLNADADTADRVLQLYDATTRTAVNVGVAAEEFVLGEFLVAFRVREAAEGGGCDLNGDGDCDDDVLHVHFLARECLRDPPPPGCLINSGQAVTPCRLEACDPRVPYRVLGRTVRFLTFEGDQGVDLNGDDDGEDLVLQVFNAELTSANAPGGGSSARPGAPAAAALASGAVTSVAAVVSGVCTTTGKPCASDLSCNGGTCFVPPGGCVELSGRSCNSAPSCSDDGRACTTSADCEGGECVPSRDCRPGEFCAPTPGEPNRPTCQRLLGGACRSDADCTEHGFSTKCNDSGQTIQRLVAPLAAPGGSGLILPSARGRCSGDPDRDCFVDADCAAGSTCGGDLIVAAASDSDDDEISDPFDNCPFDANTDQADADGDGAGDACDAVPLPCSGDCNQDGVVAVAELVQAVRVALGTADLARCPPADADRDGATAIDELIRAVGSALQGCGGGA